MNDGALISPTLPCPTCAHAVVCVVKPQLEHHAALWRSPDAPDPLITVKAVVTVECAEYLPLAEVKPLLVLDRILDPDHKLFREPEPESDGPELKPEPGVDPAGLTAMEQADRIVVEAIERDPEISYKQLAVLAGISDGTIRYRLLRLSKRGELTPALEAWRVARTAHQIGGSLSPTKPGKTKRARQSATLATAIAAAAERVYGDVSEDDRSGVIDRVHESLQPTVAEQFERAKPPQTWAPTCKSPADWTMWREANAAKSLLNRLDRPCDDCPLAYATEKLRQGRCNGRPLGDGTGGATWPPVLVQ